MTTKSRENKDRNRRTKKQILFSNGLKLGAQAYLSYTHPFQEHNERGFLSAFCHGREDVNPG